MLNTILAMLMIFPFYIPYQLNDSRLNFKIGSVNFSKLAGVRRCDRRGSGGCGASLNEENSTRVGVGVGVGVGAGGPAGGPCGVLYGKNQRRGRRRVRRRRIFIQPPEMVERQLGVAFLVRSGSSCVGTAQPTFYYPKSAWSSLPCSSSVLL